MESSGAFLERRRKANLYLRSRRAINRSGCGRYSCARRRRHAVEIVAEYLVFIPQVFNRSFAASVRRRRAHVVSDPRSNHVSDNWALHDVSDGSN